MITIDPSKLPRPPSSLEQIRAVENTPAVDDALTLLTRKALVALVTGGDIKALATNKHFAVLVNAEAEIDALRKQS